MTTTTRRRWSGSRRPPQPSRSGLPHLRLDHRVTCDQRGHDAVSAVPDVQDLAGTRQAHRRRLATLLEPRAVQLDLRPVETATTEANVCERDPCRCERRCMCDSPPFSRSSRMRTGGVEPPQPGATRLQRAELAGARRPQIAKQLRRRGLTRSGGLQGSAPPQAGIPRAGSAPAPPPLRKRRQLRRRSLTRSGGLQGSAPPKAGPAAGCAPAPPPLRKRRQLRRRSLTRSGGLQGSAPPKAGTPRAGSAPAEPALAERTGRPVGLEPTPAGITTPDARRYTTAAKKENGRRDRLPATGGRDVTVVLLRSRLFYLSAVLPA